MSFGQYLTLLDLSSLNLKLQPRCSPGSLSSSSYSSRLSMSSVLQPRVLIWSVSIPYTGLIPDHLVWLLAPLTFQQARPRHLWSGRFASIASSLLPHVSHDPLIAALTRS
jgi:hypothetical protein